MPELIHGLTCALVPRTVRAAVEGAVGLNAVTENLIATMIANGSQLVNRAFKAVEDDSLLKNLKSSLVRTFVH